MKLSRFRRFANIAFSVTILVVFAFMINALFKNIMASYELKQQQKILIENQVLVKDLEKQVVESKNPDFIERYAREKLDMLKSGEFVIIVKNE